MGPCCCCCCSAHVSSIWAHSFRFLLVQGDLANERSWLFSTTTTLPSHQLEPFAHRRRRVGALRCKLGQPVRLNITNSQLHGEPQSTLQLLYSCSIVLLLYTAAALPMLRPEHVALFQRSCAQIREFHCVCR